MEVTIANLGLRPVEALYLLSLARQENFNAQNALIAVVAHLCERRILSYKHSNIRLTKRGYRLRIDSNLLDSAEKGVSRFVGSDKYECMIAFMNDSRFSQALLEKNLISRRKKNFLSFFEDEFVLSSLGQKKVDSLIQVRNSIPSDYKIFDISIISIFPSIYTKFSHQRLKIIRSYAQEAFNIYRDKTKFGWVKPGLKYL